MSFTVNKNINGRIIKKSLNDNISATVNDSQSLGTSYSVFSTNASSLTLNNTLVTSTVSELNNTIVTPGTGTASKLLVLDSSKNISNINNLECNSITINGNTLNGLSSSAQNLYLNNITPGTGSASRALILDSNSNITNINKISTNNVEIGGGLIDISGKNKNLVFNSGNITTLNNWTSICWADSLNLFVAVSNEGNNNRIITSPDGITWTVRVSPANNNWTSLCWSQQLTLLVAVSNSGTGNRIMTSPDAINWTIQTSPADNNWTSVCWSSKLTLFVAVASSGTDNRIMTSPNGINWTIRTSPNNFNWNSICWSSDLNIFTSVGYSNVVSNTLSNSVMTSVNGIDWTLRSIDDNNWQSVCWSYDLYKFVAVSNSGTNRIAMSSDGTNWTSYAINYNNNWNNIIWAPEYKILIASTNNTNNGAKIIYSYNGLTWFPLTIPKSYNINCLTYSNTLKKICCITTKNINFTFTNYNAPNNNLVGIKDIAWSPSLGLYVAVGFSGKIMTSSNGTTWTNRTGANYNYLIVEWSPTLNLFLAITQVTNLYSTSPDGITWTNRALPNTLWWKNLIWSSSLNLFILNQLYGTDVYTTTDGINWTLRSTTGNGLRMKWISNLNLFIGVGSNHISTSPDGINWTSRTVPEANNWIDFDYSSTLNLLIAISSNGTNRMITSSNGINWIISSNISSRPWKFINWYSQLGMFILFSTNNNSNSSFYSLDGITWYNLLNNLNYTISKILINNTLNEIIIGTSDNINTQISLFNMNNNFVINSFINDTYTKTDYKYNLSNNINKIYTSKANIKYSLNNWYVIPYTTSDSWVSCCFSGYSLNNFVAVSNTGNIIASSDGHNWYSAYTSVNNYNSVCWSPELQLFAAVGSAGANRAITSSNGTNWTLRNLIITNNWTAICWAPELMLFVAVASSGLYRVAISDNGIDWKNIYCPTNNWTSICYSSHLNLLVAIANSGTNNRVMTSSDGITWTSRTSAADNNWTSICRSKFLNLFVAVANSGSGNRIMTSSDGINWTTRSSPADNDWTSIIWVNSLKIFIAIASSGTSRLMYSYDGINWILVTLSINNNWNSICWSEELNYLLMVSSSGTNNRIYRSHFFNSTDFNSHCFRRLSEVKNKLRYAMPGNFIGDPTHQFECNGYFSGYDSTNTMTSRFYHDQTNFHLNYFLNSSINIADHNGIDSGLALNNVLVTATGNQINSLSGITLGNAIKNKVLSLDSNLNLNNLNQISCNNVNLSSIFNNIVSGNVLSYNLITTDSNLNITNLNNIATNTLKIKNTTINNTSISLSNNNIYQTVFNKSNILYNFSNSTSVCWSPDLSIFAAISGSNVTNSIALSSDGINWITYRCNHIFGFTTICWSSPLKMFVATGLNTNIFYYSFDGITWLNTTNALTNNWQSVVWSDTLNMFAAVGRTGNSGLSIVTSTNGINWTPRTAPDNQWWQIIYAKNRFIVIGTIGIMTSIDGITWTNGTVPASNNWKSITYSSLLDLFVIVSDTGSNRIAYSSNLTTWTLITSPIMNSWQNVLWIDDLEVFIATASSGTNNRIMISYNAINWYSRSHNNLNVSFIYRCAWSPSLKRLVLPTSGNYLYCSDFILNNLLNKNIYADDLIKKGCKYQDIPFNLVNNWITRNAASNQEWESICYSTELNLFVAVADSGTGNRIMTSNDSINWTSQTNPVDNNWISICWSPELLLFVAVANTGTSDRIMTSPDGINWTTRTNPVDNNWTSICWSPELLLFVAVANTGTSDRIMTSPDGINWTARTNPVDNNWTSICWSPELVLFVAIANTGTNNRIMTSPDGINWTTRTSPANNNWISICWANNINLFVAVANSGLKRIMISEDGITWKLIQDPINNNWKQIIWINEFNSLIVISNSGAKRIMISFNGYDWKLKNLLIQNNFSSICWSPKLALFIIVSSSGTDRVLSSIIGYATETNAVVGYPNQLTINNITENIGLGTNAPSYRLHLLTDSAAKLSSSTWTISSDIRLKENIEDADLDLCYNNVKNLPLKRYSWKNEIYNNDQVNDRSQLGWIADDVETIFPKSIKKINIFDIEECKTLNNDQIIASLYGTIKKLITISENNNNILQNLESKYNSLKEIADTLEIIE